MRVERPLRFVPSRSETTLPQPVIYKLLALDVDGTLLRRDGSIHPADHAAIVRVAASGVVVTIVTGRLYSGTHAVARHVGIEGPVACVDGSHIVDLTDDSALYEAGLAGADAALVREVIARNGAASFLFANDTIVHDPEGAPFAGYVRTWSPRVDVVASVIDHPYWEHERGLMAVVAVGPETDIRAAVAELEVRLGQVAHVISFPVPRIGMVRSTRGRRNPGCSPPKE
jgi:hydroxymethylpyrimidine pyrophosphatase-like HAD family hydrolase